MDCIKLSERLRFDMKFLLWRAEVYTLPSRDIEKRFRELSDEYMAMAAQEERDRVSRELSDWRMILSAMMHPAKSA